MASTHRTRTLSACSGSCRMLERGTVTAFSSGLLRSGRRRCGGRAGQPRSLATRAASPLHLPTHGSRSSHAQTGGPAPPASPTFRRPLGSARASCLRSSARKGRFVRAPLAPRHRAARAADPGTRPSRGRDWGPARASFPYVRSQRSQKHAGASPAPAGAAAPPRPPPPPSGDSAPPGPPPRARSQDLRVSAARDAGGPQQTARG